MKKKVICKFQQAWKKARSDERWEILADKQMLIFSAVSVMLPSQITYIKTNNQNQS
jgi:hypothetical protein